MDRLGPMGGPRGSHGPAPQGSPGVCGGAKPPHKKLFEGSGRAERPPQQKGRKGEGRSSLKMVVCGRNANHPSPKSTNILNQVASANKNKAESKSNNENKTSKPSTLRFKKYKTYLILRAFETIEILSFDLTWIPGDPCVPGTPLYVIR